MTKLAENPTTIRFTSEDKKILKRISKRLGLTTSGVLKLAIRKLAKQEGV